MGFIDIAEKRRPQDGRIKILVAGKDIDMRVSIIPTSHGQSVVMRILDRDNIKVGLQDLGFGDEDFARFKQLIKRPNGILLVTGPTGSGKTTTLYAALNELNRPDVKIITAEDPVEYYLPGVNQCEVKAKIGMTFARIIRAMLRQNPNILLVGEIRDLETAETAIQASSDRTLGFQYIAHERCAQCHYTFGRYRHPAVPGCKLRACNHGAAVGAESLSRNARCGTSRRRTFLTGLGLRPEIVKKANFMKGKGCNHCNKKGYRGRMGIYELMTMTPQVREMAFKGESTQNVRKMARKQGMRTLFEDGMIKAIRGMTTIDEVLRITQRDDAGRDVRGSRRRREAAPRRLRRSDGSRAAERRTSRAAGADRRTGLGLEHAVRASAVVRVEKLMFSLDRRVFTEIMMSSWGSGTPALTSRPDITNRWTPGF